MNTMADDTYKIFVGKSHQEPPGGRIDKIAPMGYGLHVKGPAIDEKHWGYGYEKNTEVMFARGLVLGLEIVLREADDPVVEVITAKLGTKDYMESHVMGWLRKAVQGTAAESKDGFYTWKRLLVLHRLGHLRWREPTPDESNLCKDVQDTARQSAWTALERWRDIPAGFQGAYVTNRTDELTK